ncbi:hypothetical protein J1614_010716 [Plenodomus biglobosus]|nr:hypothetical protein J1614_010716 [Plenodomus biglobosus]
MLAIAEAKLFWSATDTHNLVLSVGCGVTQDRHNEREGPLFCCAHSFLESMSATKQDRELLLGGHSFTRLDPTLDMEVASLNDFEAIPCLQQSFSRMLVHDLAFSEALHTAAFQLLASIFYFEIASHPMLRPLSKEYSVMGMIRPRLSTKRLQHLYSHTIFHPLCFVVNGKAMSFAMPKKVNLRVRDINAPLEIKLAHKTRQVRISRMPRSVSKLIEL